MSYYKTMQISKSAYVFLFFLLGFSLNLQSQNFSIHISPHGNDKHKGTENKPVATIEQANQLVRKLKQQDLTGDTIWVFFHKGIYRLKHGITLNSDESGAKNSPIIYRNIKGEKVVITGAITLKNHKNLSPNHFMYKNTSDISNKIIEIDLTETGLTEFNKIRLSGFSGNESPKPYTLRELYYNGKPMQLSRWPNNGYTTFTGIVVDSSKVTEQTGIVYRDSHISNLLNEPNILLHGYWKYLWADAYEQVSKIDTFKKIIWLTPPYNHYYFDKNKPFAVYNAISEIDKPEEWAYDYQNKNIYFYPPEDFKDTYLELSVCEEPLLQLKNAAWITIKGIHFRMSAGQGLNIVNSNHITIENCEISNCAGDGIIVSEGQNNTISSCRIFNTGRGAIKISGGNRETLEKSEFIIDNCHIHHLARIDHTYNPGIWVDGVGSQIRHCKIHDIPSSAMRINGNDHTIEYNEIYNVVTESDDQGAIDMWGDPTYRGNVFRYNYIYDVGPYSYDEINAHCGRAGIRFDDAISGNLVYSNIFKNCSGGLFGAIQIHGGKENLIWNNIFYQCSSGISFTTWSKDMWLKYNKKTNDFFEKNRYLYISRYPELIRLNEDLNSNSVIQNIFIECQKITQRKPNIVIFQDNIEIDKPVSTTNLEEDNYSVKSILEVKETIKFEPIHFENIGLRNK